jgi:hypothetical protein
MPTRRTTLVVLTAGTLPGACSRDDPQMSLEAAVRELQANLEGKKTGAVLDQLDPAFRARQEMDREWAKRTMTLLFLRHANVKVVAVGVDTRVDPVKREFGQTDAQVVVAGAQELIPDRIAPYRVRLQWRRDGSRWKLLSLDWEE